jgi:hypothetical protein
MAHYCICAICNQKFDRDKVQAVKHGGRRYSHYKCEPDGELVPLPQISKDKKELNELNNYIKNLLGDSYNSVRIKKQLKEYVEKYNYTYSGIQKSLFYFYEIKKNSIEKANGGIGIVPYIYEEAKLYYYNLYLAKNNIESSSNNTKQIQEVTIESPKRFLNKIKLFKFLDMEE